MLQKKETFLLELLGLNIIAFGSFELKSGIISPFYIDLRKLVAVPKLLGDLSDSIAEVVPSESIDLVCGVPYAAMPIASVYAFKNNIALILKRKAPKAYGTKKSIEGVFQKGQKVLLLEDTITTGKSLMETIEVIEQNGLVVHKIIAVIDRKQGGIDYLKNKGYDAHSLFDIYQILKIYLAHNAISSEVFKQVSDFLFQRQSDYKPIPKKISYEEKITLVKNPTAKKLLQIAVHKKSNIILAADCTDTCEILNIAKNMGAHLCALKLHIDIVENFSSDFINALQSLARTYNFLLFEDRKFADIGYTQQLQFEKGIYKISDWADLVTVHPIGGEKSLLSLAEKGIGLVPIVQLSSQGNLINTEYAKKALEITEKNASVMAGVVAQEISVPQGIIKFIPGVNLATQSDDKGQKYITPKTAFLDYKADFIIIGRGILQHSNPLATLLEYKKIAWESGASL